MTIQPKAFGAAQPAGDALPRLMPLEPRIMLDGNLEWGINSTTALTSVLSGLANIFADEFDTLDNFLDSFDQMASDATRTLDLVAGTAGDNADLAPAVEAVNRIRAALDDVREAMNTSITDLLDADFGQTVASALETWLVAQNPAPDPLPDPYEPYAVSIAAADVANIFTLDNIRDGSVNSAMETFVLNLDKGDASTADTLAQLQAEFASALGLPQGNLSVQLTDIIVDGQTLVGFADAADGAVDVTVHLPQAVADFSALLQSAVPGLVLPLTLAGAGADDGAVTFTLTPTADFDVDSNPDTLDEIGLSIANFDFAPLVQVGGAIDLSGLTDPSVNLGLLDLTLTGLTTAEFGIFVVTGAGFDLGFTADLDAGTVAWNGQGNTFGVENRIKNFDALDFETIDGARDYLLLQAEFDGALDFGGTEQAFTTRIDLTAQFGAGDAATRLATFLDSAQLALSVDLLDTGLDATLEETLESAIGSLATMGAGQIVDFLKDIGETIAATLRDAAFDVNIPLTDVRLGAVMQEVAAIFSGLADLFTVDKAAFGLTQEVTEGDEVSIVQVDTRLENVATVATGNRIDLSGLQGVETLTFTIYGPETPGQAVVTLTDTDVVDTTLSNADRRAALVTLINDALGSFGFVAALTANGALRITTSTLNGAGTPQQSYSTLALTGVRRDGADDTDVTLELLGFDPATLAALSYDDVDENGNDVTIIEYENALRYAAGLTGFDLGTLDLTALDGLKTLRLTLDIDGTIRKLDVPATKANGGFDTLADLVDAINTAAAAQGYGITAAQNAANDGLAFAIDAAETRSFEILIEPDDLLKALDVASLIAMVNAGLSDALGSAALELTEDGALIFSFPDIEVLLDLGADAGLNFNTDDLALGTLTGVSLTAQVTAQLQAAFRSAVGIDLVGLGLDLIGGSSDSVLQAGGGDEGRITIALLDNVFLSDVGLQASVEVTADRVTGSASVGLLSVAIGADDASANFITAAANLDATLVGRDGDGAFSDRITLRQLQDLVTTTFDIGDDESVTRTEAVGISSLLGRFEILGGIVVDGAGQGLDAHGDAVTNRGAVLVVDPFDPDQDAQTAQLLVRLGDVKINVVGISGINEDLIQGISLSVADLSRLGETWEVALLSDNADLQSAIGGLDALQGGDVLDSLVAIANVLVVVGDTLSEKLPFLDAKIPLLNFSILDQINFAADFLTALQEIRNNPQNALDGIKAQLERVFGQGNVTLDWDGDNQTILFDLSFKFLEDYQETVPFNFDLAQILGDALADVLGDDLSKVVSGLVDAGGDGQLIFDPELAMVFSFGIDLSPLLVQPTVPATAATRLADLASTGAVNLRPDGGNDLRITHTDQATGTITRVEVDADGAETLGELLDAINTALAGSLPSVTAELDADTGAVILRDADAFTTDDAGLNALFGGAQDAAVVDDVLTIALDADFDGYADAHAFTLLVNDTPVTISIAADAGRDRAGFVTAFNAALVQAEIDRAVLSASGVTGFTVSVGQLFDLVDEGGELRLIASNFAEANGWDIPSFAVAAQNTGADVTLRLTDLGGANLSRVLGFASGGDGTGEMRADALFEDVSAGAPRVYLDTVKTGITASFTAGVNDGLNLKLGLGPIEVQVVNGRALITAGEGSDDPAFMRLGINDIDGDDNIGQYDLGHLFSIADDPDVGFADLFDFDVGIGIDLLLPLSDSLGLFNPTRDSLSWNTTLIGTLPDFNLSNVSFDAIGGDLVNLSRGLGIDPEKFSFNLPDLTDFLSSLNVLDLLNNPRLVLGGLDLLLDQMQRQFDRYLSGINLPVVGDAIGSGVTFFNDFRNNVILKALEYANTPKADGSLPTTVDLLVGFVNDALNDLLGTGDVQYLQAYLDTSAGTLDGSFIYGVLNFNAIIFDAMVPIDFDLGIPGFNLEVEQGSRIQMQLDYGVNIGFGYDRNGFFLLNDTDRAEVGINFTVDAGTFQGSMKLLGVLGVNAKAVTLSNGQVVSDASTGGGTARVTASLTADLFGDTGLQIVDPATLAEGAPDVTATQVYRAFTGVTPVDANGNPLAFERVVYVAQLDTSKLVTFDFSAQFDIQIGLEANVLDPTTGQPLLIGGKPILPSVMTEIVFDGVYSITTGLQIDTLLFNQVRLDANVLYEAIIKPVLDPIMGFLTPLQEFFDFLNNPPISYLTQILGNVFPILNIVTSVSRVVGDILNFVSSLHATGGMIIFGDFDFSGSSGDIQDGEKSLTEMDQRDIQRSGNTNAGGSQFGVFGNINSGFAINIPLLSDPFSAINLLTGKFDQVDLIRASFTLFNVDTGRIDLGNLVLDSLGAPGWVKRIINSAFSASIEARLISRFEVGYDLSGIVNFINSYDPERLLDGVFIEARPGSLVDAYIGASLRLNLGIAGLEAAGYAGVKLSFNDIDGDGKLRIPELIALIDAADGADLLGYLFKGTAEYGFFLKVWAGIKINLGLFKINLTWSKTVFDFNGSIDFGGNLPRPSLTNDLSDTGNTAILNVGARAGGSFSNIVDGDDRVTVSGPFSPFQVTLTTGGQTITSSFDETAGAIIIPAGEGDNEIDISGVSNGIPTITYTGAGADRVILPRTGVHVVFAGNGVDRITAAAGASGTYIIFGDGGEDTVQIDGGNVVFFGDSDYGMRAKFMADFASGGVTEAAILQLLGLNADGTINTSGAANYLVQGQAVTLTQLLDGYTANTQLNAANTVETVTVGSGNHIIMTGRAADIITVAESGTGVVKIYSGAGDDVIRAGGSNVLVEAGAGADYVKVNGTATEVWGWGKAAGISGQDSTDGVINSLALSDGADVLIGGTGADTLHGQLGNDIVTGGLGADDATGGLGNDIIAGGVLNLRTAAGVAIDLDTFDPSAPLATGIILAQNDAADGSDTLRGGLGDDVLLGGGGDDNLQGESGSDILIGDFADLHLSSNRIAERVVATFVTSINQGTDVLLGGAANDILMAGGSAAGQSETLTDVLGNNVMIGDFADITGARVLENATRIVSIASARGGADAIITGRGNDMILGGEGADTITAGLGGDIILGDNGDINITGSSVTALALATDGNDVITLGSDPVGAGDPPAPRDVKDIVLGGLGNDSVTATNGGLVFIGDTGQVSLDPIALNALRNFRPAGVGADADAIEAEARARNLISTIAQTLSSTANAADGNDSVTTTGGDVAVILGGGSDQAQLGDGLNYVLGDDGQITVATNDDFNGHLVNLASAASLAAVNNDTISAGDGRALAIGGFGGDQITLGGGDNLVLGDSGTIADDTRVAGVVDADLVSASETSDGDDDITATDGRNRIIAGGGADTIVAGDGQNLVITDSGDIDDLTSGMTLATSDPLIGGNDDVTLGDGDNLLILGAASDVADLGTGDNIVLGDSGVVDETYATQAVTLTSASQTSDGDDNITATDGRNRIIAGGGADTIVAGNGGNLVVGDSGAIDDLPASVLLDVLDPAIGGNDQITTGSGADYVVLGAGSDLADLGNGDNLVLGDNGVISLSSTDFTTITTTVGIDNFYDQTNGDDTISTGLGNDVIIGAFGDDVISAAGGRNIVIGDMGEIMLDAGLLPSNARNAQTLRAGLGGADAITTGDGADMIIGGAGADTIASQAGQDVMIGDDGNWTSAHIGGLGTVQSTLLNAGFDDIIDAGSGNDIVIAGLGADMVTTGAGEDVVLGDDGVITLRNLTDIETITMLNQDLGGNDTITAAATLGDNILIGQAGADVIRGGDDDDLILGDLAVVQFDAFANRLDGQSAPDRLLRVEGIRIDLGFADQIFGGAGADIVMAGFGDDTAYGGDGQDFIIGDSAILTRTWQPSPVGMAEIITIDTNFAFVIGGYDELHGDAGPDVMIGSLGPDLFFGNTEDDLLYSDGYAGIFHADWSAARYDGATPQRFLFTSNFAGANAVDVVSSAQQDDSIGNPLSITRAVDAAIQPEQLDDVSPEISQAIDLASDFANTVLGLLGSDAYVGALAALDAAAIDNATLRDALYASVVMDLGALTSANGINFELLLRRVIELFVQSLDPEGAQPQVDGDDTADPQPQADAGQRHQTAA